MKSKRASWQKRMVLRCLWWRLRIWLTCKRKGITYLHCTPAPGATKLDVLRALHANLSGDMKGTPISDDDIKNWL